MLKVAQTQLLFKKDRLKRTQLLTKASKKYRELPRDQPRFDYKSKGLGTKPEQRERWTRGEIVLNEY